MVDATGLPLSCLVTAANEHDVTALLPVVLAIPLRHLGEPDRLPSSLLGDQAYDSAGHEDILASLGVRPLFAQRGREHGSGLGKQRYVVEQTIASVHHNRRLKVRYEKRSDIHLAFLTLACIKLCFYRLSKK